jgi:epoxyqueuosine reductase
MNPLMQKLTDMIEARGWRIRVVPVERLKDLREAIRGRHDQGLLDEAFYQERLSFFSFDLPADLPGVRSLVIMAVPTPQMRILFHWRGEPVPVIVPPTYVSYTPRTESVQAMLAAWLGQQGHRLAKPRLPLKTLAVRSGLAEYGRNNICYVPGMGSFLQLVGAFTDLPCDHDSWREPKALDRCDSCVACLRQCPTGAITSDRFLIHAERCLTHHNESDRDFPEWIDPSAHHCLFGCMRCQTACPENHAKLGWFEDRGEFSEQETRLVAECVPPDRLPAETVAKLKSLEINEDLGLLGRNLAMVLARGQGTS